MTRLEAIERAISALENRINQTEATISDDPRLGNIRKILVEGAQNDRQAVANLQEWISDRQTKV